MPIVKALNRTAADCLESIVLTGDGGGHRASGTYRATPMCCCRLSNRIVRLKETDSPRVKSREKRRSANHTELVHQ